METDSVLLDEKDYNSSEDVHLDYAIYVDGFFELNASTREVAENISIIIARELIKKPSADFNYYIAERKSNETYGLIEVIANYKNSVVTHDTIVHVVEYKLLSASETI